VLDELRQPGIVRMAGQVARDNAPVPEAGNQHERGHGEELRVILADEMRCNSKNRRVRLAFAWHERLREGSASLKRPGPAWERKGILEACAYAQCDIHLARHP
jgi:hypothetical protein